MESIRAIKDSQYPILCCPSEETRFEGGTIFQSPSRCYLDEPPSKRDRRWSSVPQLVLLLHHKDNSNGSSSQRNSRRRRYRKALRHTLLQLLILVSQVPTSIAYFLFDPLTKIPVFRSQWGISDWLPGSVRYRALRTWPGKCRKVVEVERRIRRWKLLILRSKVLFS